MQQTVTHPQVKALPRGLGLSHAQTLLQDFRTDPIAAKCKNTFFHRSFSARSFDQDCVVVCLKKDGNRE